MTAGVVAALKAEARTLGSPSRRGVPSWTLADGTLVVLSGMGRAAAARSAGALVDVGATVLVSWGMAGGLDPALAAGTVCLPATVISSDGASFGTDIHCRELVGATVSARCVVAFGKLLTAARPIDDVCAKAAAFRETGAQAVDLESLAIAEVAARRGVPFIAVRVIVDTARDALPAAVTAASTGGQVNLLRLLAGLMRSPRDVVPLLRLAGRYRTATRALAAVARAGALAPLA